MTDPIVFAIDPGKVAGWAIACGPEVEDLLAHGTAKFPGHRVAACAGARKICAGRQLVVVAEGWPGTWQSWKTALGIGKAYGTWLDHVEIILGVREDHIVRVNPARWRNDLLGAENLKDTDPEEKKGLAVAYTGVEQTDAAEAACMALWAFSSEAGVAAVEAAIGKMARAKPRKG